MPTSDGDARPTKGPARTTEGIELHRSLATLRTRPLLSMRLDAGPMLVVGRTPVTDRRIGSVRSGRFDGERWSGRVIDGYDWQSHRSDRAIQIDVRLHLFTDDGVAILMRYEGLRWGTPNVMRRLDAGEEVDPGEYYFRMTAMFETAAGEYDWLNRVLAVGAGHRLPNGPVFSVFEVR